jgi:hypothetical protein
MKAGTYALKRTQFSQLGMCFELKKLPQLDGVTFLVSHTKSRTPIKKCEAAEMRIPAISRPKPSCATR